MPNDWLAIGAVLGFIALFFLTGGTLYQGRLASWSRLGCAAFGLPAAAIVSMVLFVLAYMSQAHRRDPDVLSPFVFAAVPLAVAIAALVVTTRGRNAEKDGLRRSCVAGLVGCAVLALGLLILTLVTASSLRL